MELRIKGLVQIFNSVRAELQAGIVPGEKEAFIKRVQQICRQVEQICAQHRTTPVQLPAPSRRAYEFLKNLDLAHLPIRNSDEPAPRSPGSIRIVNLNKDIEHLMAQAWLKIWRPEHSGPDEQQTRTYLEQYRKDVEEMMIRDGFGVADLTDTSRQNYCWLMFVLSEDRLQAHFKALDRAACAARPFIPVNNQKMMMDLVMTNIRSVWRYKKQVNGLMMTCSEGFLHAPKEVWAALFGMALSRKTEFRKRIVHDYIESEEFSAVLFEVESFGETIERRTEGHTYSLLESFDRVNRAYFGGTMPKPNIHWNQVLTARKFGHYMPSRDTVMISITLDSPQVPAYVVDYVMYHELLHKKHGVKIVQGKRLAHTPEFRAEERLFAQFEEANSFLNELVRKMG
jgi:hypothetical protein